MVGSYEERTEGSRKLFARAKRVFAGGVNHNARYYEPYPLFVSRAKNQHIWDEDGNRYVDYWMGHMALILGHSPAVVARALREQIKGGTHFGTSSRLSVELGEEVQKSVPCAELLRFCNSGAEATMYLVRLARGYTGKRTVIKMAGGWHGYNTELNKGVHAPFDRPEGEGILPQEQAFTKTVKFNDLESVERAVRDSRNDTAVIFLEPVLGAGGCLPAEPDYLKGLRELADKAGILLAFDEIITGYRVALGGAQERYRVKPDLASFGKIVGGGMPIGLVAGRKEILEQADPARKKGFVSIGGGTFSENPMTMTAGLATVRFLRRNRTRVYGRLEKMGIDLRRRIDEAMLMNGVQTRTTGLGSLFLTHFGGEQSSAEQVAKKSKAQASRFALSLMLKGTFILPGHPCALSTAHETKDLDRTVEACADFASTSFKKDR
ncbi:MAG: aspartate aminotransferase family protein [Nitrososphaerales archaeon]|nr:aspartate aminotransferase family protein [Nitrososphaerales archaeon]